MVCQEDCFSKNSKYLYIELSWCEQDEHLKIQKFQHFFFVSYVNFVRHVFDIFIVVFMKHYRSKPKEHHQQYMMELLLIRALINN